MSFHSIDANSNPKSSEKHIKEPPKKPRESSEKQVKQSPPKREYILPKKPIESPKKQITGPLEKNQKLPTEKHVK